MPIPIILVLVSVHTVATDPGAQSSAAMLTYTPSSLQILSKWVKFADSLDENITVLQVYQVAPQGLMVKVQYMGLFLYIILVLFLTF